MATVYYEDLEVGDIEIPGSYEMTADGIMEFAGRYDPQPFHTDQKAARESIFGELVASGWHTVAACMRLVVDGHLSEAASLGAMGVDELRWPNPVRPGDVLGVDMEILEKRLSKSAPDRGIVRTSLTGTDEGGEVKLTMRPVVLYGRRPTESAGEDQST